MLFIAYSDKPAEPVFSFVSVGDSVGIGRDKRVCKICLGAKAEGVSRVHMNIELKLVNGKNTLIATDRSTYGTGYNGSPLKVVKERELKDGDTLQIGIFAFIIGCQQDKDDEDAEIILDEPLEDMKTRRAMKRSSAVDDKGEAKRTRLTSNKCTAVKKGKEMPKRTVQRNDIASLLMRGKKTDLQKGDDAVSDSVVAHPPFEKMQVNTEKRRHAAAAFLPSDDEEEDSCFSYRFRNRRKASAEVLAGDTVSQSLKAHVSYTGRKRENGANTTVIGDSCAAEVEEPKPEPVTQTRLSKLLDVSKKAEVRKPAPASLVASDEEVGVFGCPNNDGEVADIDSCMPLQPLMNSTQIGREASPVRENRRLDVILEELAPSTSRVDKSRILDLRTTTASRTVRRSPRKRKAIVEECSLAVKSRNRRNVSKAMEGADLLSADVDTGRGKEAEVIPQKLVVKSEPIECDEDVADVINKVILGGETPVKVKKEENVTVKEEPVEEPAESDNRVCGMDLETLRQKLEKAVQFESLERKSAPSQCLREAQRNGSSRPNYKRFKKAAQGCFNEALLSLEPVKSQIIGSANLINYLD